MKDHICNSLFPPKVPPLGVAHPRPPPCRGPVTKTVNHHSTCSDLFAGSYLLSAQKFASECYVTARFVRTIAQRSVFYAQPHVFGGLRALRNKTENLCQ